MAHAILEEQRHLGLAIRTKNYDLYLPNKDKIRIGDKQGEPHEREPTQALLLLPGALVEHTAYAGLASRLADRHGILVAVINLEPTRLAYSFLPTMAPSRLLRLAQEIEQRLQAQESSRTNSTDETTKVLWSIGGHSLVRVTTTRLKVVYMFCVHDRNAICSICSFYWFYVRCANRSIFLCVCVFVLYGPVPV
jgi:hypothetical protein